DGTLDADEGSERANQAGKWHEERRRHVNTVIASVEIMPHLVREEDEHQREREGKAGKQLGGMRNPGYKWRQEVVIQKKHRLVVEVMVLHAGADDRRAEQSQKQEQHVEPPALTCWTDDPDAGLGLLFPFEGGRKRGWGFGHRNLRSEVQGQVAEVWFTSAT